jgi:hypothetical protein
MTRISVLGSVALLLAGVAGARDPTHPPDSVMTPNALEAEIRALTVDKVAWRDIAWKTCLLDGLRESRTQNKPALLWVFIDLPADDARC